MKAIILIIVSLSTLSHAEWGTGVEIGTVCPFPMAPAKAAVGGEKVNPLYRLNPYRAALPGYFNPGPNYGTVAGGMGLGTFACDTSIFTSALANPWLSAGPTQEGALLNAGYAPVAPDEDPEMAVPVRGLASEKPVMTTPPLIMPDFGRRPSADEAASRRLLLDNR